MLLAAEPGAQLMLEVNGDDADAAIAALGSVLEITDWDADDQPQTG